MARFETNVAIVGAGPAGLSLGRRLASHGVRATLLEKERVGATWRNSPADLRVLSPWWTNVLRTTEMFRHHPLSKVRAGDYVRHLEQLAAMSNLDLREGIEVTEVRREGGAWGLVTTAGDTWQANAVVLATGYFSRPYMPGLIESDESIPSIHAQSIGDYDAFASPLRGGNVLIVGKRVTAGQLLAELHDRGVNVSLSVRSPVRYRRSGKVAEIREQLYFVYEALRISIQGNLHANSFPEMDGGKPQRLIDGGDVSVKPPIKAIHAGQAQFTDGTRSSPDLIVFATGYRPALPTLPHECTVDAVSGLPAMNGFELSGARGVYALGLDNLINFRSRYLRGIRADAKQLAFQLARSQHLRAT